MSRNKEIIRETLESDSPLRKHSMSQRKLHAYCDGERKMDRLYNPCGKRIKLREPIPQQEDTDSLV